MIYRFSAFELDGSRFELRKDGEPVPVEPQVLSLLLLLAENAGRLVTRDEMIEKIWNGRIVSEAALSSRIKAARRAIGDDGSRQEIIRTVHGKGFRFDAAITPASPANPSSGEPQPEEVQSKPSIAVLPLAIAGDAGPYEFLAEALPHEVIVELSRMRWLFVIARGSSFQFRARSANLDEIGKLLGVRYCLTGLLEVTGGRVTVSLELVDTRDRGTIWAERYEIGEGGLAHTRAQVVASVVAALEIRIADHEANRARGADPERLDAWSNYHLGLRHIYRFNKADNLIGLAFLRRAISQQADFARAHSAMSFARFQNAFLGYTADPEGERLEARRSAEQALEIDEFDPSSNVAMGRSLWLSGELDSSLVWLDRSVQLSPNYAQAIYSRAWTETLIGEAEAGQKDADLAMSLSPIDPLHYAMLATRALTHLTRGHYDEAVKWADRAAREKGAHELIAVIAAACNSLAGRSAAACAWAAEARRRHPHLTQADFFNSFPFAEDSVRERLSSALRSVGV